MLVDLANKGITGKRAADLLEEAGIIVNKNLIPYDTNSAFECGGIRPGTPALTTRGMKEPEMRVIAGMFDRVLSNPDNADIRKQVAQEVRELCQQFPIYEDLEIWQ
jgi:glycine hydroxymethyltransferase